MVPPAPTLVSAAESVPVTCMQRMQSQGNPFNPWTLMGAPESMATINKLIHRQRCILQKARKTTVRTATCLLPACTHAHWGPANTSLRMSKKAAAHSLGSPQAAKRSKTPAQGTHRSLRVAQQKDHP